MINRLPAWFKQALPDRVFLQRMERMNGLKLNTVCKSAHCPNITDCLRNNQVTFMILGNTCTRSCSFCAVEKAGNAFLPVVDNDPSAIARMVKELDLKFVVITSVSRDDLIDGGAGEFARVVEAVRSVNEEVKIEILIPDFLGNIRSLQAISDSLPDVIGHNLETIERLYADLRPQALYQLSLSVLAKIKELNPQVLAKSSLMLGLGEKKDEVIEAMKDLCFVGCDILTLGQYLAPSSRHYAVKEFISPEQFQEYRDIALSLGFKAVLSGPKIRSSYQADKLFKEASLCMI